MIKKIMSFYNNYYKDYKNELVDWLSIVSKELLLIKNQPNGDKILL